MPTYEKNTTYRREIDLADMFFNWLSHWRSFLIILLVGFLMGYAYYYMSNTILREQTKASESSLLTENEMESVGNCVSIYNECKELVNLIKEDKSELSAVDKAGILNNIMITDYYLGLKIGQMSSKQLNAYNLLIGSDVNPGAETVSVNMVSKKRMILITAFFALIHVTITCLSYIYSNTLKYADDMEKMMNCMVLAKIVDGDSIDNLKCFDRLIAKIRFREIRKKYRDDMLEASVLNLVEMMNKNNVNSLAIVCGNLRKEAEELKMILEREGKERICIISGLKDNTSELSTIQGIEGALLVAKINNSDIRELRDSNMLLSKRKTLLFGMIMYV